MWFKQKRSELVQYIREKRPATALLDLWWICFSAMETFIAHSAKKFHNIQGLMTLSSQQDAALGQFIASYMDKVGAIGPLTDEAVAALDLSVYVVSGHCAVSFDNVCEFVLDLTP